MLCMTNSLPCIKIVWCHLWFHHDCFHAMLSTHIPGYLIYINIIVHCFHFLEIFSTFHVIILFNYLLDINIHYNSYFIIQIIFYIYSKFYIFNYLHNFHEYKKSFVGTFIFLNLSNSYYNWNFVQLQL